MPRLVTVGVLVLALPKSGGVPAAALRAGGLVLVLGVLIVVETGRSREASAPAELDAPSVGARLGALGRAGRWATGQMQARQDRSCLAVAASRRRTQVSLVALRKLERLQENIGAVAVEQTSDNLCGIDSVASTITVQGPRCGYWAPLSTAG